MLKNRIFKRIFTNKTSLVGFSLVLFFALVALFAPLLAPVYNQNNPYQMPQKSYQIAPQPPSAQNWLGTTEQQYDLYYGVVWGTRLAFKVGVTVTFFAFLIGLFVGGTAAYFGGKTDETLMRLTDIVFAVPSLVLAMVIAAMLGPDIKNMMIALTAVAWPSYARLIRGDILSVKQRGYVTAARTLGARGPRILLRHILPNSIYPSVVVASLDIGYVVLTAASLSFLGLGAQAGTADWGQLIAMARNWVLGTAQNPFAYWYTVVAPGGAIFLFVLGWNLLGDAFRDILDPRQA
ncbi:MAG: ABC transporter permease [Candidatus Avelusimicrobium sp.]|uniref:ABC transporter permease n=1 Tax=Candidatus Avelusimicrobium sp. TaxID=3048833 RepID=UPI003F015EDA